MTSMPYMRLYVADYLADAAHLTTEEHGAYLLLIMAYWQRGKPLPDDAARLAMMARLSNERWTDVQRTLAQFFIVADGEWSHKRIDAELARVKNSSDKAKKAGEASGRRRSGKNPTDVEPGANGRSTDVQPEANERPFVVELQTNHSDSDSDSKNYTQLHLEQEAAREARCLGARDLVDDELGGGDLPAIARGLGVPIAASARDAVTRKLGIEDAQPLVEQFRSWQASKPTAKRARDPNALFVASAATLFANLSDYDRQRCRPIRELPIDIAIDPVAPSPQLVATLAKGRYSHGSH